MIPSFAITLWILIQSITYIVMYVALEVRKILLSKSGQIMIYVDLPI